MSSMNAAQKDTIVTLLSKEIAELDERKKDQPLNSEDQERYEHLWSTLGAFHVEHMMGGEQ